MKESQILEEEDWKKWNKEIIHTTIKGIINLFRPEENEESKNIIIRDIRNLFRLEKENEVIKDVILRAIRNLFENEEEDNYYKLVRAGNIWSNKYIEY